MGTFTRWLRSNAQEHLLRDAQVRVARAQGVAPPPVTGPFLWTRIFVPVYRHTPWAVRRRFMAAMPGSHRQHWTQSPPPTGPAV